MSFGTALYDLIIMPLHLLFELLYCYTVRIIKNQGLSIIVLSLAINLLVLPLYRRADAMQEEERNIETKLAPGVKHIKETFRGDERTMMLQEFYRRNNYSPLYVLRSAVSLFLEIPFFIAAYGFLSGLKVLNGVSFGPIRDLGAQDQMLTVFGIAINVLPILMTLINAVSTAIFTKGYPLKTKIQLYGMAAFFLVFLYDSPSGLVFYWTLNNLFSLIKTICYKLKNPKKVFVSAGLGLGLALIAFSIWKCLGGASWKTGAMFIAAGLCLCVPFAVFHTAGKRKRKAPAVGRTSDRKLFLLCAVMLAVLVGAMIPSDVVSASPQEFLDISDPVHPMWIVVSALLTSAGTFLLWIGVFYWLADRRWKILFECGTAAVAGIGIVDYLFYGKNYGNMTPDFVYDAFNFAGLRAGLMNIGILLCVAAGITVIVLKWKTLAKYAVTVGILAMCCMTVINTVGITRSVADVDLGKLTDRNPQIRLSRNGRNVVVLMLDRALGEDIPYIFNEMPELREQFSGFTYYSNVISYGAFTNFASPALYGGYEYRPVEINKRDTERLVDKQNEALKVMPVLFSQEGYRVSVYDPTYAGYQWVPDLSIYDDYPEIETAITMGRIRGENDEAAFPTRARNMFCYGVMRCSPTILHEVLYDRGRYNEMAKVFGTSVRFTASYNVLKNLPSMTEASDEDFDSFMMLSNDMTHEPMLLQEPDYVPGDTSGNAEYDAAHADRFTLGDRSIRVKSSSQISHYHVNAGAMRLIGAWFDALRAEGLYDNTRIILVSDHGRNMKQIPDFKVDKWDLEFFYPLLMVKDFGASGFTTSTDFMTNADVPTLATEGLIASPVNPFTGNPINSSAKAEPVQYIIASKTYSTKKNYGTQFLPSDWLTVHDDIWDPENWALVARGSVLP